MNMKIKNSYIFGIFFLVSFLLSTDLYAACGATTRTWDGGGGNTAWARRQNWSQNNRPDTVDENAHVVANERYSQVNQNYTVGCVTVDSGGRLYSRNGRRLTIAGDYFESPEFNAVVVNAGHNFRFEMNGTAAQSFGIKDPVNRLDINNNTQMTFPYGFEIRQELNLNGTGTTIYANGDLLFSDPFYTFTIPQSNTFIVAAGKTLTVQGNLQIDGTLKLQPGSSLVIGDFGTITVSGTGELRLEGANGAPATVKGVSDYIDLDIQGSLFAQYFRFQSIGFSNTGINVTGTITKFDYGEIASIPSAGSGLVLAGSAVMPATNTGVSFFDSNGYGNNFNVNANSYNSSTITFEDFAGIGGDANEQDPNAKIDWGASAATSLTLVNNSTPGSPTDPVVAGAVDEEFAILAFGLNQADTATDITSVTLTITGTAQASDVDYIRVYAQGASCQTQGAQIGGDYTVAGSPAKVTIPIAPGTLTTSGLTPACLHVYLATTDAAQDAVTIGVGITTNSDVTNSQGYTFGATSGAPVSGPIVTINGDPIRVWTGRNNTNWRRNQNWVGQWPRAGNNTIISTGQRDLVMQQNEEVQSLQLFSNGVIDYNNNAFNINVFGNLDIASNFNFTQAGNSTITMSGASSQSFESETAYPGDFIIDNTGGVGSIITVSNNTVLGGNLIIRSGTVSIPGGVTLEVQGNITVENGGALDIQGAGTLELANNSTLTIDAGGILELIGDANNSKITATSGGYEVFVNGTIRANGYTIDKVRGDGLRINSGATIDATNYLQNGSFKYPVGNGAHLLSLYKAIPGNTLTGMNFDSNGSTGNNPVNIYTDASIGAGTLTINSYSGNLGGSANDDDNNYLISWNGESNTIDLTQEITGPASVFQGQTYNMGTFGFQQTNPGAGYATTNITDLEFHLNGTGSSNDIDAVRLYHDIDCDGAGGLLVGTSVFSGFPAAVTFSGLTIAVESHASTPPKRCVYLEFDIASDAANGQTVGAKLMDPSSIVNDQSYDLSASTPTPVDSGTPSTIIGSSTSWTGAVNTDWFNGGNWSGGVPTSSLNCSINSAPNYPVINSGTGTCNTIEIGGVASLTVNASGTIELYGAFENSGTATINGTLRLTDDGATPKNQSITGVNSVGTFNITKTAGGGITLNSTNFTATNMSLQGSSYLLLINNGKNLILPNGATQTGGSVKLSGGGVVQMGAGSTYSMSGGDFVIDGTADAYPQNLLNKGKITNNGAGRWSFVATGGTVSFSGFNFDMVDTNGVQINGTTTLSLLRGGQFTNLSTSYNGLKAFQFNTTGSIPATAVDVGWNWGGLNYPASTENYLVASSTGCGGQTIEFDYWFGDFYSEVDTFDTSTKVSGASCTIILGGSHSAVDLAKLEAVPYDSAVDVRWETNSETSHYGFNIYRSDENGENYIQLNSSLIRNVNTSSSAKGNYRFIDSTAVNNNVYSYFIEDVAHNGNKKIHGPAVARPLASLGAPPADNPDDNSDQRPTPGSDNPDTGTISNPGYQDLGDGVVIMAQSSDSVRLQVKPAAPTFTTSSWHASYEEVAIVGYNKMIEADKPEILEKTILIEVDQSFTSANVNVVNMTASTLNSHLIQPAPTYNVGIGGVLTPSYLLDNTVYTTNGDYTDVFYQVEQSPVVVGHKNYLKVTIRPIKHNPVAQTVTAISELIIDIGLDGSAWSMDPPTAAELAYTLENSLRIEYNKTGLYQLSYDDLVLNHVDGPFYNSNIADLRIYAGETELPIEVSSADGIFNSGDTLKFYLPFTNPLEDKKSVAILTTSDAMNSGVSPLRITTVDGDPGANPVDSSNEMIAISSAEENNIALLDSPLGTDTDHFYWKKLIAEHTHANPSLENITSSLNMIGHNSSSSRDVDFRVYVKGSKGINADLTHALGLFLHGNANAVASEVFKSDDSMVISFKIAASQFFDGVNQFELRALATEVPTSDYDVIYIDKVKVFYPSIRVANNDEAIIRNNSRGEVIDIAEFTANSISIYDISDLENVVKVSNVNISSPDSGETYTAKFLSVEGTNSEFGYEYFALSDANILTPTALSLTHGPGYLLKDATNGADLLVIGPKDLLASSHHLIDQRISQGLNVLSVDVEHIYNEFNYGEISSFAIKDFVNYAYQYWDTKPKYLLLLGDGTYDPKDILAYGARDNVLPSPLVKGDIFDFASDNYFVSGEESSMPNISMGRIPTNDPVVLSQYIEKMISYESGDYAPLLANQKSIIHFADTSEEGINEKFEEKVETLSSIPNLAKSEFSSSFELRKNYTDADFKTSIKQAFNDNHFMISYYGHGAEDMWAGGAVFTNSDVDTLANAKLPIVVTMNCDNASFSDPDESFVSMGEKLIFKEDGGAIAFFGSTTQTLPNAQMKYAEIFFDEIAQASLSGDQSKKLGDIFQMAKVRLGEDKYTKDVLNSYILLGDPSMALPEKMFMPEPEPVVVAAEPQGGSGCSAFAGEGKKVPTSAGILEWLFLISLIYASRRVARNINFRL